MAIIQKLDKYYEGLAGDIKPTGVKAQSIFKETDTGKTWITFDGDTWIVTDKRVRIVSEDGTFINLPGEIQALLTGIVLAAGTAVIGKVRLVSANGSEITDDTASAAKVLPVNAAGSEIKSHERHTIIEHPFGKRDLTVDGVQHSAVISTIDNTAIEVEAVTISPPVGGSIVEVEFGLTIAILNAAADKDVIVLWRARNSGGNWVILKTTTHDDPGTSYVEKTVSGRFETVADFDTVPIDISVTIQREADGSNASGKVKNSSYVKVTYDE